MLLGFVYAAAISSGHAFHSFFGARLEDRRLWKGAPFNCRPDHSQLPRARASQLLTRVKEAHHD